MMSGGLMVKILRHYTQPSSEPSGQVCQLARCSAQAFSQGRCAIENQRRIDYLISMSQRVSLCKKIGLLASLVLLSLCFTACSTFNHDWKTTLAAPAPTNDLAGPWKGTWLSEKDGHTGELRCLVTKAEANNYQFRFKAVFWKIFRYSYTVQMPVTKTGEEYKFAGDENLGWLAGGVYTYNGKITGTNFSSTYKCKYDNGTFQLTRP
jgi:hypothetical protein